MMATALIGGFEKAQIVPSPSAISVSEPFPPMREKHAQAGRFATADNIAVAKRSDVVWLAVKPDVIPDVLKEVGSTVKARGGVIVSIAAGVTIAAMEANLPAGTRVVRVMPNLPALVSELAAGFCCGTHATKKDAELVKKLLGSVGRAEEVPEKLMDAYVASLARAHHLILAYWPLPTHDLCVCFPSSPTVSRASLALGQHLAFSWSRPLRTAACVQACHAPSPRSSPRKRSRARRRWCWTRRSTRGN